MNEDKKNTVEIEIRDDFRQLAPAMEKRSTLTKEQATSMMEKLMAAYQNAGIYSREATFRVTMGKDLDVKLVELAGQCIDGFEGFDGETIPAAAPKDEVPFRLNRAQRRAMDKRLNALLRKMK